MSMLMRNLKQAEESRLARVRAQDRAEQEAGAEQAARERVGANASRLDVLKAIPADPGVEILGFYVPGGERSPLGGEEDAKNLLDKHISTWTAARASGSARWTWERMS